MGLQVSWSARVRIGSGKVFPAGQGFARDAMMGISVGQDVNA
jgi:hypothetical protein